MKKITTLFAVAMLASSAIAGPVSYSSKGSTTVVPPAESCFGPGAAIGIYGSAFIPEHESNGYDTGGGGGILGEYFFSSYVGVQGSYTFNSTGDGIHTYSGDLVLRLPIESLCIAPYILAGGGGQSDGVNVGQWHAGAGLDVRFHGSPLGVFADASYYWHDHSDLDGTMIRAGIKWKL